MGSRLAELQARYKQRQLQEMETKLKKLLPNAEKRTVQITKTTMEKKPLEERKQRDGIDRSYPLKPLKITTTKTAQSVQTARSIYTKTPIIKSNLTVTKKIIEDNTITEYENVITDNGIETLSSDGNAIDHSLMEHKLKALEITDKVDGKPALKKKVLVQPLLNKSLKGVKEKPQLSYKLSTSSPPKKGTTLDEKKTASVTLKMSAGGKSQPPSGSPTANRPSSKQNPKGPSAVARDDLAACKFCNRRFAPDRLQTHEDICAKSGKKRRKTYDALQHRVRGTDLEPFVKKGVRTSSRVKTPSAKKSNWRQTHNDFISAIRAAKMAQAHVAKGGKLSDLPPPPPSTNPDYVQCPYCGRRFNQAAAERHIPKCATYQFNKPKPGAPGPPGRGSSRPASRPGR